MVQYIDPGSNRAERLAPVLDILSNGRADTCVAHRTDIEQARKRSASFGGRWPLRFHTFDGQIVPLPDGSVDLVISKSVLEHVPDRQVASQLADLHRVLRPGGVMIHIIDLHDHLHLAGDDGVVGDWLEALRYPPKLFDTMFSNRSTYINRLRAGEWLDVLAAAGFETEYGAQSLPAARRFRRVAVARAVAGPRPHELEIGYLTLGVRKAYDLDLPTHSGIRLRRPTPTASTNQWCRCDKAVAMIDTAARADAARQ